MTTKARTKQTYKQRQDEERIRRFTATAIELADALDGVDLYVRGRRIADSIRRAKELRGKKHDHLAVAYWPGGTCTILTNAGQVLQLIHAAEFKKYNINMG